MSSRKDQVDNCKSLLTSLPVDAQIITNDILARITTLDSLLSEFEVILPTCALLRCTDEDGTIEYKPNPLIATYNSTVSTYNATVKELLDIKQKYIVKEHLPDRPRIQRVIACCGIVVAGAIALLL